MELALALAMVVATTAAAAAACLSCHITTISHAVASSLQVVLGSRFHNVGFHAASDDGQPMPVILDIDEDFFITGDPVGRLRAAGWNNASLSAVDAVLMRLCARSSEDEAKIARIVTSAATGAPWSAPQEWKEGAVCERDSRLHSATNDTFDDIVAAFVATLHHVLQQQPKQEDSKRPPKQQQQQQQQQLQKT